MCYPQHITISKVLIGVIYPLIYSKDKYNAKHDKYAEYDTGSHTCTAYCRSYRHNAEKKCAYKPDNRYLSAVYYRPVIYFIF